MNEALSQFKNVEYVLFHSFMNNYCTETFFYVELFFYVGFITDKGHFNKADIEVKGCKEVSYMTEKESIGSPYVYQEALA